MHNWRTLLAGVAAAGILTAGVTGPALAQPISPPGIVPTSGLAGFSHGAGGPAVAGVLCGLPSLPMAGLVDAAAAGALGAPCASSGPAGEMPVTGVVPGLASVSGLVPGLSLVPGLGPVASGWPGSAPVTGAASGGSNTRAPGSTIRAPNSSTSAPDSSTRDPGSIRPRRPWDGRTGGRSGAGSLVSNLPGGSIVISVLSALVRTSGALRPPP